MSNAIVQKLRDLDATRRAAADEKYRTGLERYNELRNATDPTDAEVVELADLIAGLGFSIEVVEADAEVVREVAKLADEAAERTSAESALVVASEAWGAHTTAKTEAIRKLDAESARLSGEVSTAQWSARSCREAETKLATLKARHPRIFGSQPTTPTTPPGIVTTVKDNAPSAPPPPPLRKVVQHIGGRGREIDGKPSVQTTEPAIVPRSLIEGGPPKPAGIRSH